MAPINKTSRQKITYEDAYPLKPRKPINGHQRRSNIWKKTLNLLKDAIFDNKTVLKVCSFTAFTISYLCQEKKCTSIDFKQIRQQLEERILKEKQNLRKKDDNTFISSPKKDSAQDFAGLLWSWRVNDVAKKAGIRIAFLQKCLCLTLETMTDIDVHILVQLLKKYKSMFPKLQNQIINYKQTARYLQGEIFKKKNVIPNIIKALNHWFQIMPLLEEIRLYTGWLYLLKINAFLLDADTLYNVLMKAENMQENA